MGRVIVIAAVSAVVAVGAACSSPGTRKENHFRNGEAAVAQGRPADALVEFRTALSIDPAYADAHRKLADVLAGMGDAPSALQHYVRAADLRPDDYELQIKTGNLLMAVGRVSDARARAENVLKQKGDYVEAHLLLGNALGGLQELERGLEQIQEAVNLDPQSAASRVQLGIVQQARGDLNAAEGAFKHAVELSPNWPGSHLALANFYLSSGKRDLALRSVDAALAKDPKHEGANRAKALLLFITGKQAEAEKYLQQIAQSSSAVMPKLALADYYLATGKLPQAIQTLTPLAADPRTAGAAAPRLARAHASAGDLTAARQVITAMLVANPKNAAALVLESQLLLTEGRRAEAIERARMAVDADPASAMAHYALGKAYASIGDASAAEASFKEVLKKNPQATPALLELSLLRLGDRPNDSVQLARAAITQRPADTTARMMLVRGLIASGDLERASRELAQLNAAGPIGRLRPGRCSLRPFVTTTPTPAWRSIRRWQSTPRHRKRSPESSRSRSRSRNREAARTRVKSRLAQPSSPEVLMVAARAYIATDELAEASRSGDGRFRGNPGLCLPTRCSLNYWCVRASWMRRDSNSIGLRSVKRARLAR